MFVLTLDGNPTATKVLGLDTGSITLRRDEKGAKVFSFASQLTFLKGADYDYIKLRLIDDPNAVQNFIKVVITDDCCDRSYEFKIDAEHIDWCQDICTITVDLIEFNENTQAYNCLESTLIFDNHNGFQSLQHPRITYCNELRPDILTHFVMVATILFMTVCLPIVAPWVIIMQLINLLIAGYNAIPGVTNVNLIGDGDINIFDDVRDWFNKIVLFAVGCGRKHPSPLVRDYINNVCAKCGVSFTSPIFTDSSSLYYNSVYFSAPVKKGVAYNDTTTYWIDENRPLHTGTSLLDELKIPFNADWRIVGNVLNFDRKDKFINTNPWIDSADLSDDQLISLCFNWSAKKRPAFANFIYNPDAVDWVGSEAKARWSDIVEWNSPFSPLQKGEQKVLMPYSPARFRDDGLDEDILKVYDNIPFFGFIRDYNGVMIMHSGTSYTPKLLIWDPSSGVADARVQKGYVTPTITSINSYNAPYWFDESFTGNLYDFHVIDNPKLQLFQGKDFTLKLRYDCAIVNAIDIDRPVRINGYNGNVNTIEINSKKRTLTIKGTI